MRMNGEPCAGCDRALTVVAMPLAIRDGAGRVWCVACATALLGRVADPRAAHAAALADQVRVAHGADERRSKLQ